MANSYFNDQAKLADARALARSFSQTKPPKTKGNSRPRAHNQDRDAQLRGAAGAQLTQSIVRPGGFSSTSTTSHRQPPRQFHARQESTISMATWQARKDAPSITGGRGLDFLSRKDGLVSIREVQLAVAPRAELPPTSSLTGQSQSLANAEAPTSGVAGSVLDEFLSLMSQQEKELAKVDPLIDQLQQWHLQSPAEAKSNTVAMPRLASLESSKPAVRLPPTIQQKENIRPPSKALEQLARPPRTPEPAKCNCTPAIKPQKGLSASRFASKETGNSSFANKFSVNLQIFIHQDFCPMSERHKSAQQALRAQAEPFTPRF